MENVRVDEMNIEDRKKKILELITRDSKVKVIDLSRLFGISEVTIRNNLSDLENQGLLERVHGGAISTHKAYYNMTFHDRMKTNVTEKREIAIMCASMISDGDTIMINSGTTTLFAMQELRKVKNLTVVTNSLSIAQEAVNYSNTKIILLGGNFNTQYQFTYGDDTLSQLKRYKADKLLLSVDGVSWEEGITTYHHLESEVNRQMIARVNSTIVVADYSKIGRTSFAYIDAIENIDIVITNKKAIESEIKSIRESGVEVIPV